MTKEEAIKILDHHNKWRRGEEIPMQNPDLIGEAIDKAIELLRVVRQREYSFCDCGNKLTDKEIYFGQCLQCDKNLDE